MVERMDCGPFGESLRAAIRFPSEQFAQLARGAETGQDYAQARHYAPGTGRFNRVDPVYAGLFHPQAWNRYAYTLNNPIALVDPTGLCDTFICFNETVTAPRLPTLVPSSVEGTIGDGLVYQVDIGGSEWGGAAGTGTSTGTGSGQGTPTTPTNTTTPPQPAPNDCTDYVETITRTIAAPNGASLIGRVNHANQAGQTLMLVGIFDMLPDQPVEGFRPSLVRNGQDNDVIKHLNFMVGSAIAPQSGGIAAALGLFAVDAGEVLLGGNSNKQRQATTEVWNDVVFAGVGVLAQRAVLTGNYRQFQETVKKTVCTQQ